MFPQEPSGGKLGELWSDTALQKLRMVAHGDNTDLSCNFHQNTELTMFWNLLEKGDPAHGWNEMVFNVPSIPSQSVIPKEDSWESYGMTFRMVTH